MGPDLEDMKFVLLHEAKNEEGIRSFFTDVWEAYVKVCRQRAAFFCCPFAN